MSLIEHSPESGAASPGLSAAEIAAAIGWWRDAGIDHDFADAPQSWLARPKPEPQAETRRQADAPAPPPPAEPLVRIGGDRAQYPQTLEGFAEWWLSEPSLDNGMIANRIAPQGAAGAKLMILAEHPEADSGDELFPGPQGKLLRAMLGAMGIAGDEAYLATALPRHTPLADWQMLKAGGLGDVAAHHIRLAAPQRLIIFGEHVSSLLGHDPAKSTGLLTHSHLEGAKVPLLTAPAIDGLLARPRRKARLWNDWLNWG